MIRDRVLGAMLLVAKAPRDYVDQDVELAQEVARRSAIAVENAQLYAASQRAIGARDSVLRVVAHDLRNPLNGVKLSAQFIQRCAARLSGQEDLVASAETIIMSVGRADRLIHDLLDVTRIESGHLALKLVPYTRADFLRDIESMRLNVEAASKTIVYDAAEDVGTLLVDRDRVLQIISNLIDNAIKFTPAGGRIEVHLEARGSEACVRVVDSGPGIPRERMEHLFDPFWQGQSDDRRGIGLGLAIAKGLVEAHHGRIWVDSTPGQGTTFGFALPRAVRERA